MTGITSSDTWDNSQTMMPETAMISPTRQAHAAAMRTP